MMKKGLKKLIAVLVCVMLCLVFAACTDNQQESVTLVDFPAERTETVELGDTYQLRGTTVSDTAGNEYRVSSSVTRSDGEEVLVIGDEFDIEYLGGYTIVYTAQTGDSTQTSTVTLTVVDNERPLIRIGTPVEGTVGSVYTLPQIIISDLSGNIAEQSIKVYLTEGDEEQTLTETDGTYTFRPASAGEYRIVVRAKDAAGNEDQAEISFTVNEVFEENVIFSPSAMFAADRISASQPVTPEQVSAGGDGHDYLSIVYEPSNQQWVNLSLNPVHDIASYEAYDYISVWMYAAAKDGTVYFSFFDSLDYQVTFNANEWYEAILPMDAFIQAIESGTTFLPVNFHSTDSPNHQLLTEFRLGAVTAKSAAEFTVDTQVSETVSGNAEVTITVASDADSLPAHTLSVREKDGETVYTAVSSEGGVYTYSLPAGTYSYELVCTDDGYVADGVTGEFTVENLEVIIDVPEVTQVYRVGDTVTIPDGQVLIDGKPSSYIANYTAKYTYAATDVTEDVDVDGDEFTPKSSGTLENTYTSENAVSKALFITVARAFAPGNVAADLSNQDALLDFAFKGTASGTSRLFYVEARDGEPAYLSWTTTDGAKAAWVDFYMTNPLTAEMAEGYDFVKITVKAMVGENSKYRWRLLLCNNAVLIGDQYDWYDPERLPTEEWCEIYIPINIFVANCASRIICLTLNAAGDGNADDIEEVRFAGFELVKSAGVEIEVAEHENTVYTGEGISIPSASLVTEDGEPAEGTVSVQAYSLISNTSVTEVQDGYEPTSIEETIVILYTYPTAETVRVELRVQIAGTPANEILDAGKENAVAQLRASNTTITDGNDGVRDYISVSYSSSAWIGIYLTPSNDLTSYADYDYVSVWLYAVADEGQVKFSFFNNLNYQVTFNANEWYEARIPMDAFIAQMQAGTQFLPVNFNSASSPMHKNLTEIRIGDITAVNETET